MKSYLAALFVLLNLGLLQAQPVADFSTLSNACLGQSIQLNNSSLNSTDFVWDFSNGDLLLDPSAQSLVNIGGNIPTGIDMVFDGVNWYGFVASKNDNSIIRLEFGSSLTNIPVAIPINGILGSIGPTDIKIVFAENEWFGFVYGASQLLTRLNFGNLLTNIPTVTTLINGSGGGDSGLDVVYNSGEWFVVLTNASSQITVVRLVTIRTLPTGTDIVISLGGSGYLGDIKLIKSQGKWFGYTVSISNKQLWRMEFNNDLLSTPTISDITGTIVGSLTPYGLDIGHDNGENLLFISTSEGNLIRVDLGATLTDLPLSSSQLGNLSNVLSNTLKLKLVRQNSTWTAFSVSWAVNNLFKIIFPEPENKTSVNFSSQENPVVKYSTSGSYFISLQSRRGGAFDETEKNVVIQNKQSPVIDISTTGICTANNVLFSTSADQPLAAYAWNFGDNSNSASAAPSHQYLSNGGYLINLKVIAQNACENFTTTKIKIYNSPSANFTPPTGLICTNNEFTFTNNTVDNFDGNLSYQWLVDNVQQSTSRDLKYAFPSGGNKEIKLITSIPGCTDESVQLINNVLTGPTVGFNIDGKCEAAAVSFTNTSSGDITGYVWDSGNGQTSTATNFSNSYPTKGTYNVSLKTTASNGCASTTVKPLTIYSKPQPNFSLDLPPFSCSGTPSQFNDLTPGPTDSNLSSWTWNFGDAGTSTERNPLHTFATAGDYNVSLTATTNFGCSGSFQKSVTIAASPPADFLYTAACINQGTRFSDASGTGVKSWFWTIGSNTYAFSNPTHVFSGSGSYSAKLTVTGNNNCVATVTKTINVPVAPSLSFSVDNACETQATKFKDTSPTNIDPAAAWSWDFAGQGIATGSAAQYSFAKAGSYAVKMTSTQQSGCVYSLSKNITINTTPVASFTSSPEWGVPPLSVQFTNTSTGASSYSWHFNDKNNSTSTQASPSFQFTDLGDYVVDLLATSALGCSSSASGKISVIIPSLDLELKQLQLVKDPASNVYRIFVTVKNKSNYLLTSVDVVVDIAGNALIKETINTDLAPDAEIVQLLNNQILPRNSLTYLCASVEVDNDNDPFNNSKCEPVEEETVVFDPYPNPSNGAFRFQWIAPTTDNAHFEIFNTMGQLAFEQYAEQVQVGLNQVQFDLSNLNTGAYYFRFSSNSTSRTLPIQIVR